MASWIKNKNQRLKCLDEDNPVNNKKNNFWHNFKYIKNLLPVYFDKNSLSAIRARITANALRKIIIGICKVSLEPK